MSGAPHPTLSPAKQALREARLQGLGRSGSIPRRAPGGDPPLSFAQERLWFLDRLQPGLAAYNLAAGLRLPGKADEAALERALGEVVRRHEALRTTFREVDGVPAQVVAPFAGFTLPVDDLSGMEAAEREAEVGRRASGEAAQPFDLAAGPLFRARLLRLDAEDRALLLCMHHIVYDGWSMGVLLHELSALYEAFRAGRESPLPELPVQYADYAAWQRERLRGEVLERQVAYWRERLAGAPELLELPTDHPRPAVQAYGGAREQVEIPGELLRRIEGLGRGEDATPYMVLLGAFQVLLGRYSGSEDVVVGSPTAGRARREVEGLIGLFVNTLVIRTGLSGDPSFREVLQRVREVTLGAYEHQDLPFEKLVAELQPERSLSHSPLFQVEFILQTAGGTAAGAPGAGMRGVEMDTGTVRFDLSLDCAVHARGIRCTLEYRTDLFERSTIRRMLEHLERVLDQVTTDPDTRLSGLELLGEAERRQVVEEWSRTEAEHPACRRCIHQLFEEQVARTPDAPAVVWEDASLTYAELDERSDRLAHRLRRHGVGPEVRVGICLERSPELVVAILGVLKAGGAYLPLDPAYPAERLAYVLEDSGASVLVTRDPLRALLPADGVRIVAVDADAAGVAAEPAGAPRTPVTAENLAYVIYTSGSTGRPKGVQVTHAGVASFFAGMDGRVGGTVPGTWLAVTRVGFDIHVLELLWTLARGFRVVLQPEIGEAPLDGVAERIRQHEVTHLQCTPSLAGMVIAESGAEALSGLDRLLLGGEVLPADLAAQVTAVLPGGLVNLYGPTETTVWSTTHAVVAVEGAVPIGRPIANTRVYVLDATLGPQPVGVPGELCIGGAGVARGYLGRPGLTAERFVPDPFAPEPGQRMYRTGDRARWRRDGTLEYLGRLDTQVKVRGFRIEPGEVEAALRLHPAVRDCVVVAREDTPGQKRLVAYVVGGADADALRTHLRRSLPDYMVPGVFVALDSLPLAPGGKLDRRALPAPEYGRAKGHPVAPRTPAEEVLAGIWAEVLGVERVGVLDSFFELGGDSILSIQVISRARAAGLEITPRQIFEHQTVGELAAVAGRSEGGRAEGLEAYASGDALAEEAPYWLAQGPEGVGILPVDGGGSPAGAGVRTLTVELDEEETRALLREVPAAYRTGTRDVLLCALADAVGRWTGSPRVRLALAPGQEADPARTAGAADTYPVVLDTAGAAGPGERLKRVKEQLRAVPNRGIGYGMLRHLGPDPGVRERLAAWPEPEISFDYPGGADPGLSPPVRPHRLAVSGAVVGGTLRMGWTYREGTHREETIRRVADGCMQALRELIGHCREEGACGYTPSDFPLAGLGQEELDALLAGRRGVEDLYPLSPMQEGMLFHVLRGGETQAYRVQFAQRLEGSLDVELLQRAWATVVGRHAFLRTAYLWEGLRRPLQRVDSTVRVPWIVEDWRHRSGDEQEAALERYMAEDRARGWALDQPPLLRLALFRARDDAHWVVVSQHSMLLDGWTSSRVRSEVLRLYQAWSAGEAVELKPARPYREYLEWLWRQDLGAAERYWRGVLAGFRALTPLGVDRAAGADAGVRHSKRTAVLAPEPTQRLLDLARRTQVTVNTVLSAAWGVLLSRYGGEEDVVFGSAVSVRPTEMEGVEEMVGTFINTLPVRMHVRGDARLGAWLGEVQRTQAEAREYAYAPLAQVQGWSEAPRGRLFDTLFVLENYPAEDGGAGGDGVRLGERQTTFSTSYPLTLIADSHRWVNLMLSYDESRFEAGTVERMLEHLTRILEQMAGGTDPHLSQLELLGEPERRRVLEEWSRTDVEHPAGRCIHPEAEGNAGTTTVGKPLANARTYVLDRWMRPQPVCVPGELYVGGAASAHGHMDQPGLTAERFVPDPFSASPGARLHRTGERVRWRADGTLEHLGHPDEPEEHHARPVPTAAEERNHLRPGTEMEKRIAAIWQELLAVETVEVEDNFFDLGGHSLALMRLQARLAADLGHEVPVAYLFQHPTVRSLAARLEGRWAADEVEEGKERGRSRHAALGQRLEVRRRRGG